MRIRYGFDETEWDSLRSAVADAVAYVSKAETGKVNPVKEIAASARYLSNQTFDGPSSLVRGLSGATVTCDKKWPAYTSHQIEPLVMESLGVARDLVAREHPEQLDAFRELIVNTARASVAASTGVDDPHTASLELIEQALQ